MVILSRFVEPLNVLPPISVSWLSGSKVTNRRPDLLNVKFPIAVTLFGILILIRFLASSNALAPISSNLLFGPKVIDSRTEPLECLWFNFFYFIWNGNSY